MRFGKLLIGSCIILVSVWVVVGEQLSGVSSDAVVNARLGTVRAPLAGKLDMPLRAFGETFQQGETIAVLTGSHRDETRLDDLHQEEAMAAADLVYLAATRTSDKKASLDDPGAIAVARNDVGSDLFELATAAKDTDDAEVQRAKARLAAVKMRIGHELARLENDALQELPVPVEGVLWEVLAGDGEYVERGQEVAKVMACGSALVTLSVPDHVYARLRVGQSAKFRLNATPTVYEGTITRMAGSGAETIYRNLAVAPSRKHLERYDVALLVPELRSSPDLHCSVGQTGRVFFESRPLDWLRSALR